MSSSSVKKTTAWIVRAGVEAVLLLIFIVPQYFVPDENVEVFRLACSTVVTAATCIVSWNVGVTALVHCVLHVFARSFQSSNVYIDGVVLVTRILSFERLVSHVIFPRISYEARLQENKRKLEKFFSVHDKARVSEAEALLHEYMGNEQLLFVKLRRAYLARQPPTRVVLKGT
ncbi:hypothetical protein AeMF1_009338 [Aphanomyces euteiches]|nr:hypothetical protein AeMF1_009338 [Aphanomyces euteiches]KAH9189600.1 hypothetical protein AeNC1_008427 [Aphanomyces euteiches]